MVLIEFREAALNRAFDELDEAKSSMKKAKLSLCNVEDALCELYESHDEMMEEEEYSDTESGDSYDAEVTGNDIDINYRRRRGMRGGMRYRGGMRGGMRMRHSNRYTY
jgi:hypothetical protein